MLKELEAQNNRVELDGLMEPWPNYPFWEVLSSAGEGWKVERSTQPGHNLQLPISPKENSDEVIEMFLR